MLSADCREEVAKMFEPSLTAIMNAVDEIMKESRMRINVSLFYHHFDSQLIDVHSQFTSLADSPLVPI